jgi:hypothetical protein
MPSKTILAAAGLAAFGLVSAASAQAPGWGGRGWGNSRWDTPGAFRGGTADDREGHVDAASFVAEGAAATALGHGTIAVELEPQAALTDIPGSPYEAAVIDQMVRKGYDTNGAPGSENQVAELRVTRDVLVPAETKHNPVSGEMDVGVSNRGSAMGLGLNLDFRKPRKALLSTRLEARIRDKASGAVLWEGRASIATRDGDDDWGNQAIAAKLADALFDPFPGSTERPHR